MKLRPPTFTIGQVWFDFVKRLPRTTPRYRGEPLGGFPPGFGLDMSQATAQAYAAQMAQNPYMQQQQYGSWLNGLGTGLFGFPYTK